MGKKKNRGNRKSSTNPITPTATTNHVNNESIIIRYLRKIFSAKVIGVIVAIIGATAGVIAIWPESQLDKTKKHIYTNIEKIESSFHPRQIPTDLDSLKDVALIREFQNQTLDCCTMWKSVESSKPYSDFSEEKRSQLKGVLEFDRDATHKYIEAMRKSIHILGELKKYGEENGIDNYTLINQSKLSNLYYKMELKDSIKAIYFDQCLVYVNKGNWKKGMKELDKIKEDIEYYLFDDAYFDYVIEVNDMFNISLRRYMQ